MLMSGWSYQENEFGSKTCKGLSNPVVHMFVGKTFQAEGRTNAMVLRQERNKQVIIKGD